MTSLLREDFGATRQGRAVARYTLRNAAGAFARIIPYGAILTELHLEDREGRLGDVVLGFDNLAQYESENPFFGCIAGRVANRIARGRFSLDGVEYQLALNRGPNHLHGGLRGFDKVLWEARPVERAEGPALRLSYLSPEGEEGYPGNLQVALTYMLTDGGELRLEYEATTDRATPINLTNHSYFNLAGSGDILEHRLTIYAAHYTETDEQLIPTGEILPVAGTPLDFTRPAAVGARMGQLESGGYDHNYVFDHGGGVQPRLSAELYDPGSGRLVQLLTTEPGMQLYTANHLGRLRGKHNALYDKYHGLCLEAQHFPDSINQPHFPPVVLRPGETYRQITIYRFSTR